MPVTVDEAGLPVTVAQIEALWRAAVIITQSADSSVYVAPVTAEEIRTLNRDYRSQDVPTNVLTLSYGEFQEKMSRLQEQAADHDVLICLAVAETEAAQRGMPVGDYVALLLAHGFLHVCGMDHERSESEANDTQVAEQQVLKMAGFAPRSLS